MKTNVVHVKKHSYDVYIGRPSKYGNPFRIGIDGNRIECISKYKEWLLNQPTLIETIRTDLKGKTLGCWCKPQPCHGDIIAHICNIDDDFEY